MSEYQYYEFLAIDRPLSAPETAALRAISSRARITPVSFVNEYQWGDFKGNPRELMKRYFDAHIYLANWGSAIFMVRLPLAALDRETAKAFAAAGILDAEATKTHWVIGWHLDESEDYERFGMEDGTGWMARLSPLRDELLRGDLRGLYIGWLAAMSNCEEDDDELEPLLPEGLGKLTPAQQALAEFLDVDGDLLIAVGMGAPDLKADVASQDELDAWFDGLSREEVRDLLKQLLSGQGAQAERQLKNNFHVWRSRDKKTGNWEKRRTLGQIRDQVEKAKEIRLRREQKACEQTVAARRKRRENELAGLAANFPRAWQTASRQAERGSGLAYDEVCQALADLAEAYSLHMNREAFNREMETFMARHGKRKALVQRLVKVRLWREA